MEYEDKLIVCADCGNEFAHTGEDQARYAERGFTHEPKRCRECRAARKVNSAGGRGAPRTGGGGGGGNYGGGQGGSEPGNSRYGDAPARPRSGYDRPAGGGGYRSGGGGGGGGGYRSGGGGGGGFRGAGGPKELFPAVCATCGKETQVPFKPNGTRPVLCRECYRATKG